MVAGPASLELEKDRKKILTKPMFWTDRVSSPDMDASLEKEMPLEFIMTVVFYKPFNKLGAQNILKEYLAFLDFFSNQFI